MDVVIHKKSFSLEQYSFMMNHVIMQCKILFENHINSLFCPHTNKTQFLNQYDTQRT